MVSVSFEQCVQKINNLPIESEVYLASLTSSLSGHLLPLASLVKSPQVVTGHNNMSGIYKMKT